MTLPLKSIVLLFCFFCHAMINASVLYVAPTGKTDADGSLDKPFGSIAVAVDAMRALRTSGYANPITIYLREGRHQLDETLVLGRGDGLSGEFEAVELPKYGAGASSPEPYLKFVAYSGESVQVSAGVPIGSWDLLETMPDALPEAAQGKVWVADMPEGMDRFYTLYDKQGRLQRARSEGFTVTQPGDRRRLYFPEGALKDWDNLEDVEIQIRPSRAWAVNMLPLASVDEASGIATTAVTSTYPMDPLPGWVHNPSGGHVWVENVLEALDEPGEWVVNTPWANGWFNLNTQLSYWFLATANRLEVAESLFTKLDEKLPTLVSNMPAKYGGNSAGMSTIVPQTFISPFPSGRLGFTGELLWTCHNYWLMLERTMDAERTTENFFPLLKKSVNTYLHFAFDGEDSRIHLPYTRSPEYGGGEDCNFNLALFRWGCATLIEIAERYEIDDPLLPKWKDVVARLVDYPVNENGFMVAKDFPFEKSHRHYSHLMMIYPLCEINIDQPENRKLIAKSVDHWINYPGNGNAGYSWSGAAAMYALMADGETAGKYLDIFMKMQELYPRNPAKIHPTTMYTETPRFQPVTETPLSLCDSMQLMLLQSWGDTIRVFHAIPDEWKNVTFDGLLAKGAFEVSASRKDGRTEFVSIKSHAGEPCKLLLDFIPERVEGVELSAVQRLANGRYVVEIDKGEEAIFFAEGVRSASVSPVDAQHENMNKFGLN